MPAFSNGRYVRCVSEARFGEIGVVIKTGSKGVQVQFDAGTGIIPEGYLRSTRRRIRLSKKARASVRGGKPAKPRPTHRPMVEIWSVRVVDIVSRYDPFAQWDSDTFAPSEVKHALREGRLNEREFQTFRGSLEEERIFHIERIAYLCVFHDPEPIELEVSMPVLNYYLPNGVAVSDGHHRLAASVISQRERINVIYGGQEDFFHELFPDAVRVTKINA